MTLTQVGLSCLLLVVSCSGFYTMHGMGGDISSEPTICSLPSKPCRLQVTMNNFDGTPVGELSTQTCSCNGRRVCPDDWSLRNQVISRNLVSTTYNMTINMMFCQRIQPKRLCRPGEEALSVSGTMAIPRTVDRYNCRCNNNSPLQLHRRRIGEDHLAHHSYVCDYHKAVCPSYISHCLVIREDEVDYNCKCPSGLQCRADDNWGDITYGYCRP